GAGHVELVGAVLLIGHRVDQLELRVERLRRGRRGGRGVARVRRLAAAGGGEGQDGSESSKLRLTCAHRLRLSRLGVRWLAATDGSKTADHRRCVAAVMLLPAAV